MVQARSDQEPDRRVSVEGHCGSAFEGGAYNSEPRERDARQNTNASGEAGGVLQRFEIQ